MAPVTVGPEVPFSSRRCPPTRPKPPPDEVPWNWGKPPAGLDQAPPLAGDAHQCLFQSSKLSTGHLSKHPRVPRLFAHRGVSRCCSLASAVPPAWQHLPFTHHRNGNHIFIYPKPCGFEASLASRVLTEPVLDVSAALLCSSTRALLFFTREMTVAKEKQSFLWFFSPLKKTFKKQSFCSFSLKPFRGTF